MRFGEFGELLGRREALDSRRQHGVRIAVTGPRPAVKRQAIHSRQAVHYQVGDHQIARITALEDRQRSAPAVRLRNEVTDFAEILGGDPTDIRIVVYDKNVGSLGGALASIVRGR